GVRDEMPKCGWPGVERSEVLKIQGRDETIRVDPGANALGKNMAVDGQSGVEIRAEEAIGFRIHPTEVHAKTRHAATAVGEEHQIGWFRVWSFGFWVVGRWGEKMNECF